MLATLLLLSLSAVSLAAPPPVNDESDVNIRFSTGDIVIRPPENEKEHGFWPMDLNFGRRSKPIRREKYVADGTVATEINGAHPTEGDGMGGPYTEAKVGVLVADERPASTSGWTLDVSMAQFVSGGHPSFDATLWLLDGAVYTNGLNGSLIQLLGSGSIRIDTDGAANHVLVADTTLGPGSHGVTWTNDNIMLELSTDFGVIETDVNYQAQLTWLLETT